MPSVTDHFNLASDFELRGDQVHAVPELVDGLNRGDKHQVLLGGGGRGGDRQVDRSDSGGYQDPMANAAAVTDDDIPF